MANRENLTKPGEKDYLNLRSDYRHRMPPQRGDEAPHPEFSDKSYHGDQEDTAEQTAQDFNAEFRRSEGRGYEYNGDDRYNDVPTGRFSQLGEHSGKGPKSYRRSEERMIEEACEKLTAAPNVDASEIEVRFDDDVLVLVGSVETESMKQAAEICVSQVMGLGGVRNELRVVPNPTSLVDCDFD